MTKHIWFQIFAENRLVFKLLNISNKNGIRIGPFNVPDSIFRILLLMPSIIGCISIIHYCFDPNLNFVQISSSIDLLLGTIQMAFTFLTLAIEKENIVKTVDELQKVVDKSKLITFLKLREKKIHNEMYLLIIRK